MMKLQTKIPEGFVLFPNAVSSLLVLVGLLLTMPAQPTVTKHDVNSQVCSNHIPADNWSQLHTLMHKPTVWVLIE